MLQNNCDLKEYNGNSLKKHKEFDRLIFHEINRLFEDVFIFLSTETQLLGRDLEKSRNVIKRTINVIMNSREMIDLLLNLYIHDKYTLMHSKNVTAYSMALAIKLDYKEEELLEICLGGLFHDAGKCFIPKEVLNKPSGLTKEEFVMVQRHSFYGYNLLQQIDSISENVSLCAYQHHERMNGSGYPNKLKEGEIHSYSKILAVADVFEAMTSDRPYRKAMSFSCALDIMERDVSSCFDELVFGYLKEVVKSE